MKVEMNFNETVKVKLTDTGVQELKRQHYELNDRIKARGGKGFGEFELKTDEEGYTEFQFWILMQTFGHMMNWHSKEPFEGTIIIPNARPVEEDTP